MSSTTTSQARRVANQASDETATATLLQQTSPDLAGSAVNGDEFRLSPGSAGDHIPVAQLLQTIFRAPSASEFQSQLDNPQYEPTDRLVVRRRDQLVGHLRTAPTVVNFGELELTAGWISGLGVAAEYRNRGIASALLATSESQLVAGEADLALVRTSLPEFFARRGWVLCGRHSYSTASTRKILAHLATFDVADESPLAAQMPPLEVRLWRHVEQDELAQIYENNTRGHFGPPPRDHAYWRWLVSRGAFERIYVAVEGSQATEGTSETSKIVGYAVIVAGRIIELMTDDHQRAARALLARACSDAIERDENTMRLNASPDEPLHQLLVDAGGTHSWHEAEAGEVTMVRLFDPPRLLHRLRPQLFERAKSGGLKLPTELGLMVDEEKQQIALTRRSAKLVDGKLGRSYLTCNRKTLVQLLLGHLDVVEAVASGRLEASTRVAVETAAALFPRLPVWIPPLDHLLAD